MQQAKIGLEVGLHLPCYPKQDLARQKSYVAFLRVALRRGRSFLYESQIVLSEAHPQDAGGSPGLGASTMSVTPRRGMEKSRPRKDY